MWPLFSQNWEVIRRLRYVPSRTKVVHALFKNISTDPSRIGDEGVRFCSVILFGSVLEFLRDDCGFLEMCIVRSMYYSQYLTGYVCSSVVIYPFDDIRLFGSTGN